ncbi:MAG TPA: glycosyltransferase family 2 protein [Acidimicrobiales bacterium]|nr:glycosyltransferase family 2 protein [Acidimicrobiales bacterium]
MTVAPPTVSILIPAYRAHFLDLSIASALGQTFTDFELLISDDDTTGEVEGVVSKWSDDRIRYMRNPGEKRPGGNRDFLISIASGTYVKFLFDDDFLFPKTLERVVHIAESRDAQLVFTAWYIIDENGGILSEYEPGGIPGSIVDLSQADFFDRVVAQTKNFIGGPTNLLLERKALTSMPHPFDLDGIRMRFLSDVVLFMNFSHCGHKLAGANVVGSVFRQHEAQYSSAQGPAYAAGLYEWELLQRWAADHGHISPERCQDAIGWRHRSYQPYFETYPELASFVALGTKAGPDGRFLTEDFLDLVRRSHEEIDLRRQSVSQR